MHFQLTFGKAQIAGYNPSSKALFRSSKVEEIWLLKRIGIKVYGLNENLDLVQNTKKTIPISSSKSQIFSSPQFSSTSLFS